MAVSLPSALLYVFSLTLLDVFCGSTPIITKTNYSLDSCFWMVKASMQMVIDLMAHINMIEWKEIKKYMEHAFLHQKHFSLEIDPLKSLK